MVKTLTKPQPAISRYQLTLTEITQSAKGLDTAKPNPITVTVERGEFVFHLDAIALTTIQQAQVGDVILSIPKGLRAELLYYSIFEESGEGRKGFGKLHAYRHLQSGLTFRTCWYETHTPQAREHSTYQVKAAQTIIAMDGDILHQVCKDYLDHPQGADILKAHCWLMSHLLQGFRSSVAHYLDLGIWGLSTLSAGGSLATTISSATSANSLPTALGIAWFCGSCAAPIAWNKVKDHVLPMILPRIQRWIWQQLMNPDSRWQSLAKTALRI